MLNIVFVCGMNRWRSPTAEAIYQDDPRVHVRSAGLSRSSKRQLSAGDLEWADLVLVMENQHKAQITEAYRHKLCLPKIDSLDIPDDYRYMDDDLIDIIRSAVEPYLA